MRVMVAHSTVFVTWGLVDMLKPLRTILIAWFGVAF
jgi:hypothetical protein